MSVLCGTRLKEVVEKKGREFKTQINDQDEDDIGDGCILLLKS